MSGPATSIAIVAHLARSEAAHQLFDTIHATYLHMDNGHFGCRRSHLRCWEYLEGGKADWGLVVEDDAEPVADFNGQLEQVLAAAPTPIVSFYLGTGYPPQLQQRIGQAVAAADRDKAHWITADNHLHGVAVAIQTPLIPSMLEWVRKSGQPVDYAIRDWARNKGHRIGFTHPSIVDHHDGESITKHPDGGTRTVPRKAWRLGTRDQWTRRTVNL